MQQPPRTHRAVIALAVMGATLIGVGGTALANRAAARRSAQPACGATVTASVILNSDLRNCHGDGIVIGADHITLDLNGHTISGDGVRGTPAEDAGILDNGHAGVKILHGTVRGFDYGVRLEDADSSHLRRLLVRDNGDRGILLDNGSNDNDVRDSQLSSNPNHAGMAIVSSSRNVVYHDSLVNNDVGIYISGTATGNRILDNTVSGSPGGGVVIDGADGNTVGDNRVARNADNIIVSGDRNRIDANHIADATGCQDGCGFGLSVEGGANNIVTRNVIVGTARNGIRLDAYGGPVTGTLLQGNSVRSAGADDIAIDTDQAGPVLDTTLDGNITTGAAADGIHVESSATTLMANVAAKNGNLGIESVSGVVDGGGNRASGNVNPLQCTNVSC